MNTATAAATSSVPQRETYLSAGQKHSAASPDISLKLNVGKTNSLKIAETDDSRLLTIRQYLSNQLFSFTADCRTLV